MRLGRGWTVWAVTGIMLVAAAGCSNSKPAARETPPPQPPVAEAPQNKPNEIKAPEPERAPELSGALLAIVENSPQARPQSGLEKADLVYEALAEGGITRFMALYYTQKADRIGPIRSARYYFVELAKAYNAPFAHAGGNADALALIPELRLPDMDEIYNAGAYFQRTTDRVPPHNLYTSTDLLLKGARAKGFTLQKPVLPPVAAAQAGDAAGTPAAPAPGAAAEHILISFFRGVDFSNLVTYDYDNGRYLRRINGTPHTMESGAQIAPANVAVIVAPTRDVKKEEWQLEIKVVGEGPALYFSGGQATEGKWRKTSPQAHLELLGLDGKPVQFRPGQTWIEIIPDRSSLEYR